MSVPKTSLPTYNKLTSEEPIEDPLLKRIQSLMCWSDREMQLNMQLLENTVLKDKANWKSELGIK